MPNFSESFITPTIVNTTTSTTQINSAMLANTTGISTSPTRAITFQQITKAIDDMPPLQRDIVADGYKGLRVEWEAYFKSGTRVSDDKFRIRLNPHLNTFGYSIICNVKSSDYPGLVTLPEGAKVKITGEIEAVDRFDISLMNACLSIC